MVSDASARKHTKHAIPRVHMWTLSQRGASRQEFSWSSLADDHGLCKFHSKLWNHGPIFGGDVHLCIPNHFCNLCFSSFHIKNVFSIFRVPGGVETGAFLLRGHQGQCAEHHHSIFHGWGTGQGCHIQEARNYLGLLPYNELFLP
jgi:hypothetical protein